MQLDAESRRLFDLSLQLIRANDNIGARALLREVVNRSPNCAEAHFQLASTLFMLDAPEQAEKALRRALELDPDHPSAAYLLGGQLLGRGDSAAAAVFLRRAVERAPGQSQFWRLLGLARLYVGDSAEARAAMLKAVELEPTADELVDVLARLQSMGDGSDEGERLFKVVSQLASNLGRYPQRFRAQVLFALAKAYDDRGDYERAFAHLHEANRLQRGLNNYDPADAERQLQEIARVFNRELFARISPPGAPSGVASRRPVFIVGMPRSGSTLVEQILSAHPDVQDGGELPVLPNLIASTRAAGEITYPQWAGRMNDADCLRMGAIFLENQAGARAEASPPRLTDKWLENFRHVGLIRLCLPNATVIHCRRDPRDVAVSAYSMRFAGELHFAYDLSELGRYWRAYDRLMAHWREVLPEGWVLDVPYEEVVEDLETWARRIVAHCGLDWRPECLDFHKAEREVRTSSYLQVRSPIYKTSVGRWKRYEAHLGPLLEALGPEWAA